MNQISYKMMEVDDMIPLMVVAAVITSAILLIITSDLSEVNS